MYIRTRTFIALAATVIGITVVWYWLTPHSNAPVEREPETVALAPVFDLTLKAIQYAPPPGKSHSTLATASGEQGEFKVGDNVFNRATITAIHADYIELDRGGARYTLWLTNASVTTPVDGAGKQPTSGETDTQIIASAPDSLDKFGALDYQPVRDGTRFRGMRVDASESGSPADLGSTGLQSGDMITRVNGVPLADERQFVDAIRDITKTGRIEFGIERDHTTLSVTIEVTE